MSNPVDAEAVDRLRAALTRIARRIDRQVSGDGLTSTQLSVLASVVNRGPLGMSELAEVEGINPTMLSRIVGRLEQAGLIERQADADDRRAVRVAVTAAGVRLRKRLLDERSRLLNERLAALPADTVDAVLAALPALEALASQLAPKATNRNASVAAGGSTRS
jgi:DNA-binding MarR family transcriptional regulator